MASYNLIGVSADVYESAINTARACNLGLLLDKSNICQIEPRRQHNGNEANGKEEPDRIDDLGGNSKMPFNFEKAQPQHFGFICGYGLGSVSVAAAGSTGYKHTIVPITFDLDAFRSLPSFPLVQRLGNQVLKERFTSMFVNDFTAEFAEDSWVKLSGNLLGTGLREDNVTEESITTLDTATSLTLAANGVQGSDAATRLSNVHRIIAETSSGVWVDVAFSAVSAATPAVITITAPGAGAADITYKVMYIPTEAESWHTFPSRVTETALRVVQFDVTVGGKWSGSAHSGGHSLGGELKKLTWKCNNNLKARFSPGSGNLNYADRCLRSGRVQTVDFDREFKDYIFQQHIDDNDTFVVYMLAEGAEYESGHKYTVEVIFPKVGVMSAKRGVADNRLSESPSLQVLEDSTYGSVIVNVKNMQAKYAQAS